MFDETATIKIHKGAQIVPHSLVNVRNYFCKNKVGIFKVKHIFTKNRASNTEKIIILYFCTPRTFSFDTKTVIYNTLPSF
jgi:hypothetical protein